jgi:hypothetical protein
MLQIPTVNEQELHDFCRRNHIRRLAVFGSASKGVASPESDIDVLVDFAPGHVPGLRFFEIEDELSQLFGRRVDLNTRSFLSRHFRDRVEREAVVRYAAS